MSPKEKLGEPVSTTPQKGSQFTDRVEDAEHGAERYILHRYNRLCRSLVKIALDTKQSGAVRVAAHRVIQEYVIKPIKEQVSEDQRRAKQQENKMPAVISVAIGQLPVGTGASVNVLEPETKDRCGETK